MYTENMVRIRIYISRNQQNSTQLTHSLTMAVSFLGSPTLNVEKERMEFKLPVNKERPEWTTSTLKLFLLFDGLLATLEDNVGRFALRRVSPS